MVGAAIARCLEGQLELRALDGPEVSTGGGALRVSQRFRAELAVIVFAAEILPAAGGRHAYGVVHVHAEPPFRRTWAALPVIGGVEPPNWPEVRREAEAQFRADFLPRFLQALDELLELR